MRPNKKSILKHPEPSVPKKTVSFSKVRNLPTQATNQQQRRLVNDQKLLAQLRSKLGMTSIEAVPEPDPKPIKSSNPNQKPNLSPTRNLKAKLSPCPP